MACATTPSDSEITTEKKNGEKNRKNIRGAKFGTKFATTTPSTIKVQNKKPTFGVGGK